MKMKKILAALLPALALGGCDNDGIPYVSLGLDDLYKVARMQTVDLRPAFTGESYRWTVKTASGADSLLSEEKDYIFLMQYPGTYDVTFRIFDPVNPIVHRMTFYVVEEEVEYSPYIATVYEYCPAPGQFVNAMPEYREGDTAETMRQKAEEAIAETKSALEGTDVDAIKAATEKIQQAGYKLAEVVSSTEGAAAGAQAAAAETAPADDTIEADYEVVDDENEGK